MTTIYFEDLSAGMVFELGSVNVTRDEIVEFATRFDPQPFHVDDDAAERSMFGGLIASGWHTGSMWMRLFADTVLSRTDSRGSPGVEELRWLAPVRPGDTLTGESTIVSTAPSSRDDTRGTAVVASSMTNQDGVVVMTLRSRGMFGRRPA
ncbi:MAG: MaoC family dehydratase [Ilumatobacter sp.]|nr:MaoC family dehydratase [Ilumatobacter sp.]